MQCKVGDLVVFYMLVSTEYRSVFYAPKYILSTNIIGNQEDHVFPCSANKGSCACVQLFSKLTTSVCYLGYSVGMFGELKNFSDFASMH